MAVTDTERAHRTSAEVAQALLDRMHRLATENGPAHDIAGLSSAYATVVASGAVGLTEDDRSALLAALQGDGRLSALVEGLHVIR